MYIIIKGKNQPSENKQFKPHYNNAMGKYIGSKEEYKQTMKDMNLVPYEKPKPKEEPKYKPSKWAHEMANEIKRSDGKPGGVFYDQLAKRGYGPDKMKKAKNQYDKHFKGDVK